MQTEKRNYRSMEWRICDECGSENVEFENVSVPSWDEDSHSYIEDDTEKMLVCQDCDCVMEAGLAPSIHEND